MLARGWRPSYLPGLKLWLRSSIGITLTSGRVSAWANQAPTGSAFDVVQATAANRPIVTVGVMNGRPGVTFAAAGEILKNTTATICAQNAARYFFTVCKPAAGGVFASGGTIIQMPVVNGAFATFTYQIGKNPGPGFLTYGYTDGVTVAESLAGDPAIVNIPFVSEMGGDAGVGINKVTMRLNGTAHALSASAEKKTEIAASGFTIGNRDDAGAGQFFSGSLCEILAFNRVPSGSELSAVRRYLGGEYGVVVI